MAKLIITIDGPAASGKSTVARMLAERIDASFLDTGAMYRAVALAAIQSRPAGSGLAVVMRDEKRLLDILNQKEFRFTAKNNRMMVSIDGKDVTNQIREPEVTANVKYIASAPKVREKLVEMQRQFAASQGRIVTEGRDQGTIAFPNACLKFYLTATLEERARRRATEEGTTAKEQIEQIQKDLQERDKSDEDRTVGPMKPADDATVVDTTDLSIEEVIDKLLGYSEVLVYRVPKMRWARFGRFLSTIFCRVFFRLRQTGRENVPDYGPVVLACNHQSFLDPVYCGVFVKRPLHYLARDTLFKGLFGLIIASVNTIPVKRGEADLSAMRIVISKLKQGHGVCIFPEGSRTHDGKISDFKPGFGLLCRKGNASVVPVLVDGAFETWPRHKKLFRPGGRVTIHYGKCIPASEARKMDDRALAKRLTDTLRKMQNECRISQGKEPYNY